MEENIKIIRSRRRTISIQIHDDASLVVRAPRQVPDEFIYDFIKKKAAWIKKNQELIKQKFLSRPQKEFTEGETFLFLGEIYRLQLSDDISPPLHFDEGFILSKHHADQAKKLFVKWYREQAFQIIYMRVGHLSEKAGLSCAKIKIRENKHTWGSCSGKNNLNFNWRLIMAPPGVIDYVIIHELAHLKERNHSKRFWARVKEMFPNYIYPKRWLKENSHLLSI
ncbi:MAG: SprT family zinc-dependent metalloprotease [Candidatus Margulisiibacteriota bacterium]